MPARKRSARADLYLAIDIGGTKVLAAKVDRSGRVRARAKGKVPPGASTRQVFDLAAGLAVDALGEDRARVRGIGVGVPGIVSPKGDKVLSAPNIKIAGFPLAARLKRRFNAPAILGNDVSVALLGEAWKGGARGKSDAIGLFPGTGLGGGAIVGGRILHGANGAATEFGHMIVERGGRRCGCGKRGCLEAYASRTAIEKELRRRLRLGETSLITKWADPRGKVRSKAWKKALKRRDGTASAVLREAAEHLGDAALSLRQIFDPEVVLLGGGLVEACGKFIVPIVRRRLDADPFFTGTVGPVAVREAVLGDDAIVVGAARLASSLRE
jgi:glucokinase